MGWGVPTELATAVIAAGGLGMVPLVLAPGAERLRVDLLLPFNPTCEKE